MNKDNIVECLKYLFNYPQIFLEKSYKASSRKAVVYHKQLESLLIENLKLATKESFNTDSSFLNTETVKEFLDLTPEDVESFVKENHVTYVPYKNREYLPESFKNTHSLFHMEHTIISSLFAHDVDECEITFFQNGLRIVAPGLSAFFTIKDSLLVPSDEKTVKTLITK